MAKLNPPEVDKTAAKQGSAKKIKIARCSQVSDPAINCGAKYKK
jgi:hypothetical protein